MLRRLALGVSVYLVAKKPGMDFISAYDIRSLTCKFSVALARAVYARTKYVLLDDPLSAVVRAFPQLRFKSNLIVHTGQSYRESSVREAPLWPPLREPYCHPRHPPRRIGFARNSLSHSHVGWPY